MNNDRCAVCATGPSAAGTGNTLTLTSGISFKDAFAGDQLPNLPPREVLEDNSGWQEM